MRHKLGLVLSYAVHISIIWTALLPHSLCENRRPRQPKRRWHDASNDPQGYSSLHKASLPNWVTQTSIDNSNAGPNYDLMATLSHPPVSSFWADSIAPSNQACSLNESFSGATMSSTTTCGYGITKIGIQTNPSSHSTCTSTRLWYGPKRVFSGSSSSCCGHCTVQWPSVIINQWPASATNTWCAPIRSQWSQKHGSYQNTTTTSFSYKEDDAWSLPPSGFREVPQDGFTQHLLTQIPPLTAPPKNGTYATAADGFVFVSPSIYVVFPSVYASDDCAQVGNVYVSQTIAYPPDALSTLDGYNWLKSRAVYNPADAGCPKSPRREDYSTSMPPDWEAFVTSVAVSATPSLWLDREIQYSDDAWVTAGCDAAWVREGETPLIPLGRDPPRTLRPANGMQPNSITQPPALGATQDPAVPQPAPAAPTPVATEDPKVDPPPPKDSQPQAGPPKDDAPKDQPPTPASPPKDNGTPTEADPAADSKPKPQGQAPPEHPQDPAAQGQSGTHPDSVPQGGPHDQGNTDPATGGNKGSPSNKDPSPSNKNNQANADPHSWSSEQMDSLNQALSHGDGSSPSKNQASPPENAGSANPPASTSHAPDSPPQPSTPVSGANTGSNNGSPQPGAAGASPPLGPLILRPFNSPDTSPSNPNPGNGGASPPGSSPGGGGAGSPNPNSGNTPQGGSTGPGSGNAPSPNNPPASSGNAGGGPSGTINQGGAAVSGVNPASPPSNPANTGSNEQSSSGGGDGGHVGTKPDVGTGNSGGAGGSQSGGGASGGNSSPNASPGGSNNNNNNPPSGGSNSGAEASPPQISGTQHPTAPAGNSGSGSGNGGAASGGPAAVITLGSQGYTVQPVQTAAAVSSPLSPPPYSSPTAAAVIIGSVTISQGAPPQTIASTPVSLGAGGLLVHGSSTETLSLFATPGSASGGVGGGSGGGTSGSTSGGAGQGGAGSSNRTNGGAGIRNGTEPGAASSRGGRLSFAFGWGSGVVWLGGAWIVWGVCMI